MITTRSPRTARSAAACVGAILWAVGGAQACELCAIYSATELHEHRAGVVLGVSEQYTHAGTLQRDGAGTANPAGERLDDVRTQLLLDDNLTRRFGVELSLPIIARSFRRAEAHGVVSGDESGIGDLSLLAHFLAVNTVTDDSILRLTLLGGLKLPSGSAHRLKEELQQPPPGQMLVATGVHGHDLALGSGSTDGILGAEAFTSWRRLFVGGRVHYALRSGGDFHYHYADAITWSAGPGMFAWIAHGGTVALQALLSGESKGKDTVRGLPEDSSAFTTLYAGPAIVYTWAPAFAADLAVDVPAFTNNTGLQTVPDVRLRAGLSWQF